MLPVQKEGKLREAVGLQMEGLQGENAAMAQLQMVHLRNERERMVSVQMLPMQMASVYPRVQIARSYVYR